MHHVGVGLSLESVEIEASKHAAQQVGVKEGTSVQSPTWKIGLRQFMAHAHVPAAAIWLEAVEGQPWASMETSRTS